MTQSGAQGLTWDIRGQLRSVAGSTYNYDAFGRRTVKTEPTIVGGTTTKNYGWAGWSQTSGNQAPVVGSGLDSPIRLERGTDNSVRVPVQDSHGNVTKVFNAGTGSELFSAAYSPFGERNITASSITGADGSGQSLGFTGAEHDAVSELVYLRNRYYAPGLGRFISEDPIGFAGGSNFYAYCDNDPVNFSDPSGLFKGFGLNGGGICGAGNNPWFWFGDLPTFGPSALYGKGAYRCTPPEGEAEFAGADRFGGNWRLHPGMTGGTARSQMANDMLDGTYNQVLGAAASMATAGLSNAGELIGGVGGTGGGSGSKIMHLVDHNIPGEAEIARKLTRSGYDAMSVMYGLANKLGIDSDSAIRLLDPEIIIHMNKMYGNNWKVITKDPSDFIKGGADVIVVPGQQHGVKTMEDVADFLREIGFRI